MAFIRTEVVDLLRGAAIPKRISIEIAASSSLREVVIDTRKFKKIVYNFVSNAIKFSPPSGRITIRISAKRDKEFMVEVLDEGPGIPQDKIKLLFNPFQQVGPKLDGQDAGTGLGLALCKEVAGLLGGRVGVTSTPGEGSTFYVVLPTHREPTQVRPKRSYSKVAARPKILIVEDENAQRRFLCRTLDQAGYRVEIACDLQQAIKKCQSTLYSAITLDLALGRESGMDLLNQMGPINQHTPVIVVSSSKEPIRFFQAHVHAQLSKPVLPNMLVESLSSAGVLPPIRAAAAPKSVGVAQGDTSGESPCILSERSLSQC
jgi:CheY-like chemotaxis protein